MRFDVRAYSVDETRPLIYMWEIHDRGGRLLGRYVGKAKAGAKRPRTHYARNVANILAAKHYRKSNPNGFRKIHHVLAEAQRLGHSITLTFLCNVPSNEDINEVERRCIAQQKCQGSESWQLNG